MKLVYIAHPLGAGEDRLSNIEAATRWVAWAAKQGVAPVATWVTIARVWDEAPENRARGLLIDLAQIERCDELWLCGPRVSPGMRLEADHAHKLGLPVFRMVGTAMSLVDKQDMSGLRIATGMVDVTNAVNRELAKHPELYAAPKTCAVCGSVEHERHEVGHP